MAALPPTSLFPRVYPTLGGQYSGRNAYGQVQEDYLNMFNEMNPESGSVSSPAPRTLRSSQPSLSPPTLSMSSGAMKGAGSVGSKGGGTISGSLPVYDTGAVEKLTQRFAAPGIRNLRSAVQDVQQGYYENPNVKAHTVRESLAGYGQGLESVMGGALKEGASVYGQEYQPKVQAQLQANQIASNEAMQASSIASNEKMNQYNHEWQAYLASLT